MVLTDCQFCGHEFEAKEPRLKSFIEHDCPECGRKLIIDIPTERARRRKVQRKLTSEQRVKRLAEDLLMHLYAQGSMTMSEASKKMGLDGTTLKDIRMFLEKSGDIFVTQDPRSGGGRRSLRMNVVFREKRDFLRGNNF